MELHNEEINDHINVECQGADGEERFLDAENNIDHLVRSNDSLKDMAFGTVKEKIQSTHPR